MSNKATRVLAAPRPALKPLHVAGLGAVRQDGLKLRTPKCWFHGHVANKKVTGKTTSTRSIHISWTAWVICNCILVELKREVAERNTVLAAADPQRAFRSF